MEDTEGTRILLAALTEEEWKEIGTPVAEKLEKFVSVKFEEFITAKALIETNRFNTEQELSEVKKLHETISLENEQLKSRFETAKTTISTLEEQIHTNTTEVTNLQTTCQRLENENAEFRHQRNLAVDDRDEHLKMVQRRNAELERMQLEITTLTQQLETAITAKCEALAKAEEVACMKMTIEYKEKRMEQEKALLNSQIESLTENLNERTEELLNMRHDNSSRCIQLENKLTEKQQELAIAADQIKSLTELNNSLTSRIEELSEKLQSQREMEAKMSESYMHEVEAKTKMANTYKSMYEEGQKHSDELEEALSEVQTLLKTATEQYGELETKYKESQLANEEIITKKNEYIAMLNKELEKANELLDNSKQEQLERDMSGISPAAVSASKMLKSGFSITELYSQTETLRIDLANKQEENTRLNNYITTILHEIEEKGPLIKKLRQDYCNALDAIDALKASNDTLLNEVQQLRESNQETKRLEAAAQRELERQKKQISDLSRQVVHLLNEVEQARAGSSSTSTDMDLSDSVSSADIISKKLVTFSDISELHTTNQKLLVLVRELTERQEEVESMNPMEVVQLKEKLETLRESQRDLLEERDRQNKMMETLRSQRDMYKNLYHQAVKAAGEDIPMQLERPYNMSETNGEVLKTQVDTESQHDNKTQELEKLIIKYKEDIKQLKEDNDVYRKEKSKNEQMLVEQLEKMRDEVKELTRINCKLSSQAEVNDERFKILQNNADIHKKQINALDNQNKLYSESIIKHEQTINYLKTQLMDTQTKLANAEVRLSNFQKENILLRDSEGRLLKEREAMKREVHSQTLLQSNIELIKASLERSDAEGRLRLESRLDEAHRECASLRRRLQEEQDHFRQLSDHLEKKTNNAVQRMKEEKNEADKLRKELNEVRENLINKQTQIEDLTQKLKMSAYTLPESATDSRRIRELEQQLSDSQAEIESLKSKLKTAKETSEQYFSVAEDAEKQLKIVLEQKETQNQEVEKLNATIRQLQEKCSELEGELSIRMDDQDMASVTIRSKSHQLQEELNTKSMNLNTARHELDNARSEIRSLKENLKASDNKYARQVILHSADIEKLNSMKEDLTKALDELNKTKQGRDQALEALKNNKESWDKQEQLFQREKVELEQRFKDMEMQNSLLLDQIQALNVQLSIMQAQTNDQQNQSFDSSFNRSLTEEDVKSSEQLLKIIKFLRQEKDISVSKCDILEAELLRVKSQLELVTKQYDETKASLQSERQTTEVSVVTAAKHAEVLRKVETLNAITDSNRALRQERDQLMKQVEEYRNRIASLEKQLSPLQEKAKELQFKCDSMSTENTALKADCARWRQRSTILLEKTNRTSPEDWKKLQNERENLAKQLTIERSNTTKLNDEVNNLKQEKSKLEEQLKSLRQQNNNQAEEINRLKEDVNNLQSQFNQLKQEHDTLQESTKKILEEDRLLNETLTARDAEATETKNTITELKSNLTAIRRIAKKYKTAFDDQDKEMKELKEKVKSLQEKQIQSSAEETQTLSPEERTQLEKRIQQLEQQQKETEEQHIGQIEQLNQQLSSSTEEIDNFKKEFEALKQSGNDKEERFKALFKTAKDRIVQLTDENKSLKNEIESQKQPQQQQLAGTSSGDTSSNTNTEYIRRIEELEKEKEALEAEKQQEKSEKEKVSSYVDILTQKVNKLQKQLGLQQGSKPSTSSGSAEKPATEPPTANIKPMAGHSTNTQTQSVPIQPWRSGGEPPLASIRPMSAQLRTVAVLPTSQNPSAAIVPPQQQVHTTGSSNIEALSSSPTSSHTDYVPATSSASSMMGPRQVAVPPTQSTQDNEDDDSNAQAQNQTQQQAVALVLPRVEPPSSGSTQEQGTSSSSSNTVTTSQTSMKRPRDADNEGSQNDDEGKTQQIPKRTRVQQTGTVSSDSGLEVEYQVPTSSQRDHEDDSSVVVLDSDEEEGGADEGEGADDEPDDPDTEGYDETMEQDNYEDADCQDMATVGEEDEEEEEEAGNEVEVIEDSSEMPNQSGSAAGERAEQRGSEEEEMGEQPQSEQISSGTDGTSSSGVTISQASTSTSMTVPSLTRTRPVAPLPSRQQQANLLLPHGLDDGGDDGIVPSTPTLYVPRRSDGFGEAVSSPHVPSGRFTFSESGPGHGAGSSEVVPEQTLEVNADDNSTGRSVPSTPLHTSPQESLPVVEEQGTSQSSQPDAETPSIAINDEVDEEAPTEDGSGENMGPPEVAGPSSEEPQLEEAEEMLEGDEEVSSEGEKPPTAEEAVEEGREAEASPSTNTRSRNFRGIPGNRRAMRQMGPRSAFGRPGPSPIVWSDQRGQVHRQDGSRGRPNTNFSPRANRRGQRTRSQRPYSRY